ncbi:uncharacterized protein [Epargyreus clarus]|uniref:uncharacterized protein n=1 Tax=Epargyreus clarus TaxID=520877 RepID=UPI003C2C13B8
MDEETPEVEPKYELGCVSETSDKPIAYLEKLLDDCMLFRAGHGAAPVLYEKRHLEAVIKSFDPGNRGWLSAGQVRRMYSTLGLTPDILDDEYEERYPTDTVLEKVTIAQEMELFDLLASGMIMDSLFKDHRSEKSSMH